MTYEYPEECPDCHWEFDIDNRCNCIRKQEAKETATEMLRKTWIELRKFCPDVEKDDLRDVLMDAAEIVGDEGAYGTKEKSDEWFELGKEICIPHK